MAQPQDSHRIKLNIICIRSRDCYKVNVPIFWLATLGGSWYRDIHYALLGGSISSLRDQKLLRR